MSILTKREKKEKPVAVGFRLESALVDRVNALAESYGRSKQEVYEAAIRVGIDLLESGK
jgi:predicted transcriptional regulator